MIVIDAKDSVMGRVATKAAKLALEGETIAIVNAERAIIVGNPEFLRKRYKARIDRGVKGNPHYGPKHPRNPERIMRRAIRGMLPFKESRGRNAFKRVMTYVGVPEKLRNEKTIVIAEARKSAGKKFIFLEDLASRLGAKW